MDANADLKGNLPSRHVTERPGRAPHRSHDPRRRRRRAPGGDKFRPGMMMAMCRLNVPAIFTYGGSILPDTLKAHTVTVQDVLEAELDAARELLTVRLSEEELTNRKREWKPRSSEFTSGYLWKYAQQVGPARNGAVTHPGGGAETSCDADI
jgi:dihydroxyacid dehydratase/phosphogluconate dehydratase